jgi:Holliday junction resolvasome RuvABC DNA-binding subunit
MWTLVLFVVSVIVGYLVLRYRVHVIVVVQPRQATAVHRSASGSSKRAPDQPTSDSAPVLEIASALVNLGCKPRLAKTAAERACASGGRDFNGLLRTAIQEALTC